MNTGFARLNTRCHCVKFKSEDYKKNNFNKKFNNQRISEN